MTDMTETISKHQEYANRFIRVYASIMRKIEEREKQMVENTEPAAETKGIEVKVEEAVTILKYLAKHENNQRAIDFLNDRGVVWKDA